MGADRGIIKAQLGHNLHIHISNGKAASPLSNIDIGIICPDSSWLVQVFTHICQYFAVFIKYMYAVGFPVPYPDPVEPVYPQAVGYVEPAGLIPRAAPCP